MRQDTAPGHRVALLLGGAAGYLDAIGYLTLGLFTANMTGNTVLLGIFAGEGRWEAAGRVLLALALFFTGAMLGARVTRRQTRLVGALGAEAMVLLAALVYWSAVLGQPRGALAGPGVVALIGLLSGAMGIQSTSVRRVGELRVSTIVVTGTLTSLATAVTADSLAAERRGRPNAPGTARHHATRLLAGMWGSYLTGALAGSFAEFRWGMWAVVAPILVLAGMATWDLRGPAASRLVRTDAPEEAGETGEHVEKIRRGPPRDE